MRKGGVLKFASLYIFPRRRANGTLAAPPVGEIYRAKYIFLQISIQHPAYYKTGENHFSGFSTFSVTGGQSRNKRKHRTLSVLPEITKSGPDHIKKDRRSADRPSIGIQVE